MAKKIPHTSESDLISELKSTFPGFHARPLSEYGPEYKGRTGVWSGKDGEVFFADGTPVFHAVNSPAYESGVHVWLHDWLEMRGWYVEDYDGATIFIVTIESAQLPEGV